MSEYSCPNVAVSCDLTKGCFIALSQGLLLNWNPMLLAWLAGQRALRMCLTDSANTGMALPSFYVDVGDLNSGLHAHTSALAHGANYPTTHMHFKKHS